MKKKVLFCASAASHITNFHTTYVDYFKENGYEVHTATKGIVDYQNISKSYDIPFCKNIYSTKNISAIFKLKKIIKTEQYEIISTHSMLAGFVGRIAANFALGKNIKKIHTSHGYLFNDNGSFKAKIFLMIEKYVAKFTDALMVMNKSDEQIATKYNLAKTKVFIDGMGVNKEKFPLISDEEKKIMRDKLNIKQDDFVFLCVGEFSKRKNQLMLIRAFKKVKEKINNAKLILVGEGALLNECKKLAKSLEMENEIIFCGHISDMNKIYRISNSLVSTSKSEGLPFNIMEALLCSLPIIASKVKGHTDLIKSKQNGLLFKLDEYNKLEKYMIDFAKQSEMYQLIKNNVKLPEKYLLENVELEIQTVYQMFITN